MVSMDHRTRAYLRGRFGDFYRRSSVSVPPAAERREWGYIPFSEGQTRMVRHRSLLDIGDPDTFLERERPRHVYLSAAHYDDPDAGTMGQKGLQQADLIFDLDADHLPAIDPDEATYPAMLEACKDALFRLLDFLERDFGFHDPDIVFSGSRGYHVHVRDERVGGLGSEARREIVDYLLGADLDPEAVIATEAVAGLGLKGPTQRRSLDVAGGWGRRIHEHLIGVCDDLAGMATEEAIDRLVQYDSIGDGRAQAILTAIKESRPAIEAGNIDVHPAVVHFTKVLTEEAIQTHQAPIDEPVTTDTHRLIRLPGSLHGGSGLRVKPIDRDQLASFDPLVDAVAAPFRDHEITIDVPEPTSVDLDGQTYDLDAGTQQVPEAVGIFLMCRERAQKGKETSPRKEKG